MIDEEKRKAYVRLYYVYERSSDTWKTEYEVYFQPSKDRAKFLLYNVWWHIAWRTRYERVQDWLFDRTHRSTRGSDTVSDDFLERPGVKHDLTHYDLDHKNETVIGRVERTNT